MSHVPLVQTHPPRAVAALSLQARPLAAVLLALLLTLPAAVAAEDEYLCYTTGALSPEEVGGPVPPFTPQPATVVADRFTTAALDLLKPGSVCNTATSDGGGLGDPGIVLQTYRTRASRSAVRPPRPAARIVDVVNRFGRQRLAVKGIEGVALPAALALGDVPARAPEAADLTPWLCHAAKAVRGGGAARRAAPPRLTVVDRFGLRLLDLGRPTRLCNRASVGGVPADGPGRPGHLVCYATRPARTRPPQDRFGRTVVSTASVLVSQTLALVRPAEVCVASFDATRPTPTVSPTPGILESVRVGPATRAVLPGESAFFTATGRFSDGSTRNLTRRVRWESSDPAIATVSNVPGERGRTTGLEPGWVTITATDPGTGITSASSDESATFNVLGELEAIVLQPGNPAVRAGEAQQLTGIGVYTRGASHFITQELTYSSSDPRVAVATNAPGDRSRVEAREPGTVTIAAVHPTTGISSTESGGDATLTVLGPPLRITLSPASASRKVGEAIGYLATAHFAGGRTLNVTHSMVYASSDPRIAVAANAEGARSRVEALAAGTATISARDPVTGLTTTATGDDATLVVTGGLVAITLAPAIATRAVGGHVNYLATGRFADGTTRNLTQQVLYASSRPSVASAPNPEQNRGRVEARQPGTARISAIDPATGVTSTASGGDATLTVVP